MKFFLIKKFVYLKNTNIPKLITSEMQRNSFFVLMFFAENINLSELRTTLTFYTTPYIDIYSNNT